jgi:pimeloyl-ACP methyl ester carboxylesterase
VRAGVLDVAFEEHGEPASATAILLHVFPYDIRAFDDVIERLVDGGLRVIVPYVRGFGRTRFCDTTIIRSGQQAALAHDLTSLMDALNVESAILAGLDWGGPAACIVAALWPARVDGLVSVDGYNIQALAASTEPAPPAHERSYWYQSWRAVRMAYSGRAPAVIEQTSLRSTTMCCYLGSVTTFRRKRQPSFTDAVLRLAALRISPSSKRAARSPHYSSTPRHGSRTKTADGA